MDTLAPLKRVSLDEASKQTDAASSTMSSAQTRVAAPLHQKESLDQSEHTRTAGEAHDALEAGQEKPVRNYRLHQGTNRFCLGGRLMTSGDSLLPLIGSSLVAVFMPALFWAFNGAWLWTELGKGGKASVFVFLALVLFMWASMVSRPPHFAFKSLARIALTPRMRSRGAGQDCSLRSGHPPTRPRPGPSSAVPRTGSRRPR